ncbi:MAG: hypothetical protein ACKV2V_07650, partial [Blastocatellia bacterium]
LMKSFARENIAQISAGGLTMPAAEAARLFAETLKQSAIPGPRTRVIVLYTGEYARPDPRFTSALQKLLGQSPWREQFAEKLTIVNATTILDVNDTFALDDHYRVTGHRKIAETLWRIISGGQIAADK